MRWNWQLPDWGEFQYDAQALRPLEDRFLLAAGSWQGSWVHLPEEEREQFQVELMSQEAMQTARIEGELLDRESVQASIRRLLGLAHERGRVKPSEYGIAELTVSVYRSFKEPLVHEQLFEWHEMLTQGRRDLEERGRYRSHPDPMQIVSGPLERPEVHFEAPPSAQVPAEMERFIAWFQRSRPDGETPLPALTRAGLAHLYFESIHPFEDGNGRMGRALVEKVLAQVLGQPSLIMLADAIDQQRKAYYRELSEASRSNQVDQWLQWFGTIILEAQAQSQRALAFLLYKAKLFRRLAGQLNPRQEKVLLRLFKAGPDGFEGGLSAHNYQRITQASPATVTRDLNALVEMGALVRTGAKKSTRYWLAEGDRG